MAERTKGDWLVDKRAACRVVSESGRGIASTGNYSNNQEPGDSWDENKANALFAAAAPKTARQRDELLQDRIILKQLNIAIANAESNDAQD